MVLGVGVDIIEIERVEQALLSKRFSKRVYTPAERAYYERRGKNAAHSAAGFFAAKEAVSKALGIGLRIESWVQVEILHDEWGGPLVRLHGAMEQRLLQMGGRTVHLSISHSDTNAIAFAVVEGLEGLSCKL